MEEGDQAVLEKFLRIGRQTNLMDCDSGFTTSEMVVAISALRNENEQMKRLLQAHTGLPKEVKIYLKYRRAYECKTII